jgi:hypothetical protein
MLLQSATEVGRAAHSYPIPLKYRDLKGISETKTFLAIQFRQDTILYGGSDFCRISLSIILALF